MSTFHVPISYNPPVELLVNTIQLREVSPEQRRWTHIYVGQKSDKSHQY